MGDPFHGDSSIPCNLVGLRLEARVTANWLLARKGVPLKKAGKLGMVGLAGISYDRQICIELVAIRQMNGSTCTRAVPAGTT